MTKRGAKELGRGTVPLWMVMKRSKRRSRSDCRGSTKLYRNIRSSTQPSFHTQLYSIPPQKHMAEYFNVKNSEEQSPHAHTSFLKRKKLEVTERLPAEINSSNSAVTPLPAYCNSQTE